MEIISLRWMKIRNDGHDDDKEDEEEDDKAV